MRIFEIESKKIAPIIASTVFDKIESLTFFTFPKKICDIVQIPQLYLLVSFY